MDGDKMIQGHWQPQTDEEAELMEDLFLVTRHANNEGVSKARIASLLGFMSASAADVSVYEESHPMRRQGPEREPEQQTDSPNSTMCPKCESPVSDASASFGLDPVRVEPCGCEIRPTEVPFNLRQWFDEVSQDE